MLVGRVAEWCGRRHDVAIDIAAAAQGGAAGMDDGLDDVLQVALFHAVELTVCVTALETHHAKRWGHA